MGKLYYFNVLLMRMYKQLFYGLTAVAALAVFFAGCGASDTDQNAGTPVEPTFTVETNINTNTAAAIDDPDTTTNANENTNTDAADDADTSTVTNTNSAATTTNTNTASSAPATTTNTNTSAAANTNTTPAAPANTNTAPAVVVPVTKEISMKARQFEFEPAKITVPLNAKVKLSITSEDVDHGFSLPAFGVSATLKAGQTTVVEFTADKKGTFPFSCNNFCGSGHGGMTGSLVVE